MVELYKTQYEGKAMKSMFEILLEEMKKQLYTGAHCSTFRFLYIC
jgi:hypothetical protein